VSSKTYASVVSEWVSEQSSSRIVIVRLNGRAASSLAQSIRSQRGVR
jgi:hypothetical protein